MFLTRIGFGSILVIFPYYLNIPLSNSSLAGIIIALYPAVEGFSALPVGTFVDLGGRRKAFVAGMTMISILTLIIGLSNNLVLVGGAHALEGLAAAMVTVASLTMITDLTVKENRGASMGGFDLANLAGYGTGILLGLSFLHVFATNLGYSFLVVSAVMGASAIFVYFALHEPVHSSMEHGSLRGIYETFTGDVIGILPVWFSLTVVLGFFLFLPRLVKNAGVTDLAQSAPLILLALLVLGVGSVMFGRLSEKDEDDANRSLGGARVSPRLTRSVSTTGSNSARNSLDRLLLYGRAHNNRRWNTILSRLGTNTLHSRVYWR